MLKRIERWSNSNGIARHIDETLGLILVRIVEKNTLVQAERDERIASQAEHIGTSHSKHFGEEAVHEAWQTTGVFDLSALLGYFCSSFII